MQDIKNWPTFIKVVFGVLITTFTIAGIVEIPKLSKLGVGNGEKVASDLVDIDILVYTDTRELLEGVEARFLVKGSPVLKQTNTNGYVKIQIPTKGDIDVELRKEGFQSAKFTIDPQVDPNKNREFTLKRKKI